MNYVDQALGEGEVVRHVAHKFGSIEVEQTMLGRIPGYGAAEMRGSGVTMTPPRMIGDPPTFRRRVEDAIDAAKA